MVHWEVGQKERVRPSQAKGTRYEDNSIHTPYSTGRPSRVVGNGSLVTGLSPEARALKGSYTKRNCGISLVATTRARMLTPTSPSIFNVTPSRIPFKLINKPDRLLLRLERRLLSTVDYVNSCSRAVLARPLRWSSDTTLKRRSDHRLCSVS